MEIMVLSELPQVQKDKYWLFFFHLWDLDIFRNSHHSKRGTTREEGGHQHNWENEYDPSVVYKYVEIS